MNIDIVVPSVGESVKEAILVEWYRQDGDRVSKDDPLFVIETDKVTLEVVAEAAGRLSIKVTEGETVAIGAVVGSIDTEAAAGDEKPTDVKDTAAAGDKTDKEKQAAASEPEEKPLAETAKPAEKSAEESPLLPPSVRRLVAEKKIDISRISGSGPRGMITKSDVILHLERSEPASEKPVPGGSTAADAGDAVPVSRKDAVRKVPMTPIRRRIAARLLEARQNTAMLTTFNEIDMSRVMAIRSQYKDAFKKKFDISLGFMSFFTKACVAALMEIPQINAFIDGENIVYHDYCHVGIAIGAERGLVVPVIRNAERMTFWEIEKAIMDYVNKIKDNRLALEDLEGGTFTISNGGVYGSLLSTPILNMPQSGILGMHKIEKRPVVVDDEIVIRPMMYVALSYDHRIVDGREAVTCLKRIKEFIEDPERLLLEI